MFTDEAQCRFVGEGHGRLGRQCIADVQDTPHGFVDQELEVRHALVAGAPETSQVMTSVFCYILVQSKMWEKYQGEFL